MNSKQDHSHAPDASTNRNRLVIAIGIIGFGVVAQLIGAALSGSLALLADSGHMLSDLAGLVIALLATVIAARPATPRQTYGYRRAEVLGAMANGALLGAVALYVAVEGVGRLTRAEDGEVQSGIMLAIGVLGGLCNLAALLVLRAGSKDSINMRGAYLEVLGDLLGSAAVIIASIVVLTTGYSGADAIASLLIAALIVPRAWALLREVFRILVISTPLGTDLEEIRGHMLDASGVVDVHDVHAWQITPGEVVFTAHVVVDDQTFTAQSCERVFDELDACLRKHFEVAHPTFQVEPASHAEHELTTHR